MMFGPCWGADDVDLTCCDDIDQLPPEQLEMIKQMAAYYLWRATGSQYGLCEVTYRPCRKECRDLWSGLPTPAKIDGEWVNLSCGSCTGRCGCDSLSEVVIPNTDSIVSITEDGVELDPFETAVVYDRRSIVRIDGQQWPACQNLSVPAGEIGSWTITVLEGKPLPPGAGYIAGILACELAKGCLGKECRLPQRVQTITRQGVTVGFEDRFESLAELRVGLWEVDAFVESARTSRWQQSRIASPDVHRPVQQTWPRGPEPTMLSLDPVAGPVSGGTDITVRGQGFTEGLRRGPTHQ